MKGRPKAKLILSEDEREQLQANNLRSKTAQGNALIGNTLEHPYYGERNGTIADHHQPDLARLWPATSSQENFQPIRNSLRKHATVLSKL